MHDWPLSTVAVWAPKTGNTPLNLQELVRLTVPVAVPLGDEFLFSPSTLLTCMNQGLVDVAVHVIGNTTLPLGLTVQVPPLSPNDTLVSRTCVCVVLQ